MVIDEQHRFGVSQRLLLTQKGRRTPHVLAMTATPIPRTLALAEYRRDGSPQLDEMPPGRQAIEPAWSRSTAWPTSPTASRGTWKPAQQAYWVCPMVRGSEHESEDLAAAEARFAGAQGALRRRGGARPRPAQARAKDAAMERFAAARRSCSSPPP